MGRKASRDPHGVAEAVAVHRLEGGAAVRRRSCGRGARDHIRGTGVEVGELRRAALCISHLGLHCYRYQQKKQCSFGAEGNH